MKYEIGQKVKVIPANWRKTTSFIGKVREVTQSGLYVSRMLGKKYANITSIYFGNEEVSQVEGKMKYKVGDKIKFKREKQRYTVQACNERFAVCTKPFNPKKTVLYTVIDFDNNIRGTENLIFGMGAETQEKCQEMLERLTKDETQVSRRNYVELDIEVSSS